MPQGFINIRGIGRTGQIKLIPFTPSNMKILLACEESQRVTKAFRDKGHEAYSCDIVDCTGGFPKWHIKDDVLKHLTDGWDMMIAFPPCTYLSYAANGYWKRKGRVFDRLQALHFFATLLECDCIDKIAIENPLGCADIIVRKHDQIINPYFFGDPHQKRTCLWLKNLPKLVHTKSNDLFSTLTHCEKPLPIYTDKSGKKRTFTESLSGRQQNIRSKTFPGIAEAMAQQWG